MTDIAYEAGIKAILGDFTGEYDLVEALYAIVISDEYTPDPDIVATESMSDIVTQYAWEGEFGETNNYTNAGDVGTLTLAVNADGRVAIQIADIAFGLITDTGAGAGSNNDPGWVVIFTKTTGELDDPDSGYPLVCLKADFDATAETFTFLVDTDGIVLWDPQ